MKSSFLPLQSAHPFKIIKSLAKSRRLKVFLVGGFLRDYVLGQDCRDFDFAVSQNAIGLAHAFSKKIRGAFVLLDEEHPCARVVKKIGGEIFTYDFADFRKKTLEGDLAHRDFTINTLCVDLQDWTEKKSFGDLILDSQNGCKDLAAKKIRMVAKSAFREDPLRMIRGFSLQAELDFHMDAATLAQIKKDKESLRGVAYERIRDEFFKILATPRASENIRQMDRLGLLKEFIPQIHVMYRVAQGPYHHLNVWNHSLQALTEMEKVFEEFQSHEDVLKYLDEPFVGEHKRFSLMKLAVLLHDIGKPDAKRKKGEKMYFYGHERIGRKIVRDIALMLKLSVKERHALEDMVFWHLRPGYLSNFPKPTDKAVFRYFRDTKDEAVSILLLSLSDQRATRGPLTSAYDQRHHEKIIRKLIAIYFDKKKEKPLVRLISGNDLIHQLKLTPGPVFAKILSEVEEQQATGKISTKKEALGLAKKVARRHKAL